MTDATTSVPNPLCDVGRSHPRDRHRMRPIEGRENVWYCPKHDIYAQVLDEETASSLDRGGDYPLPDGSPGTVLRQGDERGGGRIVYVRAEG